MKYLLIIALLSVGCAHVKPKQHFEYIYPPGCVQECRGPDSKHMVCTFAQHGECVIVRVVPQ